jgi:hypothetical protein
LYATQRGKEELEEYVRNYMHGKISNAEYVIYDLGEIKNDLN